MIPVEKPGEARRRVVMVLFFAGLVVMAFLAAGIGWACGEWGEFRLGWFNPVSGSLLVVGGLSLVIWSVYLQYTNGQGTPAPMVPTQKLVTQGPYAYTRNPMTLGALWLYLGIGLWMGSGVVIVLTLAVFSILLRYIYHHEAEELSDRFGEAYQVYKRRTPFLCPRLRRSSRADGRWARPSQDG